MALCGNNDNDMGCSLSQRVKGMTGMVSSSSCEGCGKDSMASKNGDAADRTARWTLKSTASEPQWFCASEEHERRTRSLSRKLKQLNDMGALRG